MKKLLTILCLVLLSVHSYSQGVITGPFLLREGIYYHQDTNELVTGTVEYFHDNGQLQEKGNYKDGEPDGLWEEFHENGQLESRGNFINGEQDGLQEYFDEDGNLIGTLTYRNGELVE